MGRKMKRLGYRAAHKEIDSKDGNIDKKIKSYKRGEKQKAKRDLYKELDSSIKEMKKKRVADGLIQGLKEAIASECNEVYRDDNESLCKRPECKGMVQESGMYCAKCIEAEWMSEYE